MTRLKAVAHDVGGKLAWADFLPRWNALFRGEGEFLGLNPLPAGWPSQLEDVDILGVTVSSFEREAEEEAVRTVSGMGRPVVSFSDVHNSGDRLDPALRANVDVHFVPTLSFAEHARSRLGGYTNVVVAPPPRWRLEILKYRATGAQTRHTHRVLKDRHDAFHDGTVPASASRVLGDSKKIAFLTGTKSPEQDARVARQLSAAGFVLAYTIHPALKSDKTYGNHPAFAEMVSAYFTDIEFLDVRGKSKYELSAIADANVFTGGSTDANLCAMAGRVVLYLSDSDVIERNRKQGAHTPGLKYWEGMSIGEEYPNGIFPIAGYGACVVAHLDRGQVGIEEAFKQINSDEFLAGVRANQRLHFPVPTEAESDPAAIIGEIQRLIGV